MGFLCDVRVRFNRAGPSRGFSWLALLLLVPPIVAGCGTGPLTRLLFDRGGGHGGTTARHLAFVVEPSSADAGSPITPAVQVALQNSRGRTITSATDPVTIALLTNPGGGILSGTLTANAVAGVATFADLSIDRVGNGYSLDAFATGIIGVASQPFDVNPGPASRFLVTGLPNPMTAGVPSDLVVRALDTLGNTATGYVGPIAFTSTDPGATLPASYTFTAADAGVHTFTGGVVLGAAGSQSVTATDAANPTVTGSQTVAVTFGVAYRLVFTLPPTMTRVASPMAPIAVAIQDAGGNTVATATDPVTLAILANPGGGTLSGTLTVNAVAGVATFPGLSIDRVGDGYALLAFASGIIGAASPAFDVVASLPVINASIGTRVTVLAGQELLFTTTVTDPEGDLVTLRVLNPPPGCSPIPIIQDPSPATMNVRWLVPRFMGGDYHLVFEAHDDAFPARAVRLDVTVSIIGQASAASVQVGDVTGDGLLDVVGRAQMAGVSDTGALYVWAGAAAPVGAPTGTLRVPGAANSDYLGSGGIRLGDVTGDGVLDVVAVTHWADVGVTADAGAVYVWEGGAALAGSPAFRAALVVSGASASDQLGHPPSASSGPGAHLADVTGDGVLDIVAGAASADVGGVSNVGAVYVWEGGTALSGNAAPRATLTVQGAVAGDFLGLGVGQGVGVADVTGDGVLDVVAGAAWAYVAGVGDAGAVYVWEGGATLAGSPALRAALTVPGATAGDRLGDCGPSQGIQTVDVTGDGVLDIVASAAFADVAGVVDAGAVYVWEGGATLAGSPALRAALRVPGSAAYDELGFGNGGSAIQAVDVTGDGVLDIVARAGQADVGGVRNAGAIYVWEGGVALGGSAPPRATLTAPGAGIGDYLGIGRGIRDVTGDGVVDIIAGADADVGGVPDAGAIFVWEGGSALGGSPMPRATLTAPGAAAGSQFGRSVETADVTGDGVLDVVGGAIAADVGGVVDVGAVYVWGGGVTLTGNAAPRAALSVAGAVAGDRLGYASGQGILAADVTGDGVLDIVAGAEAADVGGAVDAGAAYVWEGGAALSGSPTLRATLAVPGAVAGDQLGWTGSQGIQMADVTGDGVLDVMVGARDADVGGVADVGAAYVWQGGATLTGNAALRAALAVPGAVAYDRLGNTSGVGIQMADVTGDGVLDIVAGAYRADIAGVSDTGAIYLWGGGPALAGAPPLVQTFAVPGADAFDQLGF